MLEEFSRVLLSIPFEEREVEVETLKPFFEDYELVSAFKKLSSLPPLICAVCQEGAFVVFHEGILRALKELGVKKTRALFYKQLVDVRELFYLRHALFKRRKRYFVFFFYEVFKEHYADEFYRRRREIIEGICKRLNITKQTAYEYLRRRLRQDKEQLKRRALELYSQGKSQYEISAILGVPQRTISDWLKGAGLREGRKTYKEGIPWRSR